MAVKYTEANASQSRLSARPPLTAISYTVSERASSYSNASRCLIGRATTFYSSAWTASVNERRERDETEISEKLRNTRSIPRESAAAHIRLFEFRDENCMLKRLSTLFRIFFPLLRVLRVLRAGDRLGSYRRSFSNPLREESHRGRTIIDGTHTCIQPSSDEHTCLRG